MRSILIVRLSAIGDVVMASAIIPPLRRAYPQARIDWLVESGVDELLQANTRLDEVVVWPRRDWATLLRRGRLLGLLRYCSKFVRCLRRRNYELVLDLQGLWKSAIWAFLSGAPQRLGLGSRGGCQLLMTQVIARGNTGERIASEYLHLLQELGVDPGAFLMDLPVGRDDAASAACLLQRHGVVDRYAVICPFTTRTQKHWLEHYWGELARRLQTEWGLAVVMLGAPSDKPAAQRIAAWNGGQLHNLVGASRLGETIALIRGASIVIGVDTGLTHMGVAQGIPAVALFGSTRPYLDPANGRTLILYSDLPCAPCRRHPICGGTFTCMRELHVERVMRAVGQLLK